MYNFLIKQRVDNYGKKTVAISGCDSGFGRLLAVRLVKQGVPVIAGVLKKEVT